MASARAEWILASRICKSSSISRSWSKDRNCWDRYHINSMPEFESSRGSYVDVTEILGPWSPSERVACVFSLPATRLTVNLAKMADMCGNTAARISIELLTLNLGYLLQGVCRALRYVGSEQSIVPSRAPHLLS